MLKCVIMVRYCYEALWDVTWCWHGMPLGCWCDTNTNSTLTDKWDPPKTFYFPFFFFFCFFFLLIRSLFISLVSFFSFLFFHCGVGGNAMCFISSTAAAHPGHLVCVTRGTGCAHWSSSPPGIRWGGTVASRVERWLIQLQTQNY